MATRHTGGEVQEDSDTDISEQGDRTEKGSEKEKKSVKRKFLRSKAMQRVTGRKHHADVTPVKKAQPPPQALQKRMVEVSHTSKYTMYVNLSCHNNPIKLVGVTTSTYII